jgi:hypothetical protein
MDPADGSCRRRQKVVLVVQVVVKIIARDVENALIEVENALIWGRGVSELAKMFQNMQNLHFETIFACIFG